ncbi:MAG: extracellular solute-binding protein [Spirochaetales bacterium]|nr:extracellular solute-binding protein [Spirochaetales bacterium]
MNRFISIVLLSFTIFSCNQVKGDITFFLPDYGVITEEYTDAVKSDFKKAYPRADLNIILVSWDDLKNDLDQALFSKNTPDISVVGTRWILDYIDYNFVEDLSPILPSTLKDEFFPEILESYEGSMGDLLYGLPVVAGARILAINKNYTNVIPNTMEELLAEAKRITQRTGKPSITFTGKAHTELTDFVYYFYAAGGDFFEANPDGTRGKSFINSSAGIDSMRFIKKVTSSGVVPNNFLSMNRDDCQEMFANGEIAFTFAGAWVDSKVAGRFPVVYSTIPKFEGVKNASSIFISDSIVVFKAAKNKKGAIAFLDWFYKSKWKLELDKLTGFPPITKTAAQDPIFDTDFYKTLQEAATNSKPWPMVVEWEDVADEIWNSQIDITANNANIKKSLDETAELIDIIRGYYEKK